MFWTFFLDECFIFFQGSNIAFLCDLTPAIVHLSLCAAFCMWLKHRELSEVMLLPSQGFPFTYSTFIHGYKLHIYTVIVDFR